MYLFGNQSSLRFKEFPFLFTISTRAGMFDCLAVYNTCIYLLISTSIRKGFPASLQFLFCCIANITEDADDDDVENVCIGIRHYIHKCITDFNTDNFLFLPNSMNVFIDERSNGFFFLRTPCQLQLKTKYLPATSYHRNSVSRLTPEKLDVPA